MKTRQPAILIVRLSAMGDILSTLPAVSSLRKSFPEHRIVWTIAPKWLPLLEGNPDIDEIVPFHRNGLPSLLASLACLRAIKPEIAIDFQTLIYTAAIGRLARPRLFYGWDAGFAREFLAGYLYSRRIRYRSEHVVDQNLELAAAAGASETACEFHIPAGSPEGALPMGPFVLANPFAGWAAKEWPLANYAALSQALKAEGLALVLNVPPQRRREVEALRGVEVHVSTLPGLIDATRRAVVVLGLDSGPLHLAAALRKPGVALYGPTDPVRNGPYGGTVRVIRAAAARTSHKRRKQIDPSMKTITVDQVHDALRAVLNTAGSRA
jgi:heptosyltransferase-1